MRTFVIVLFSILFIGYAPTALPFSNLIVFGDSLSDNGNFPESPQPFVHPNGPHQVGNTSTSFYVPFSNPVDHQHGSATPPLPGVKQRFAWPQLDPTLLAEQIPIQGQASQRQFRSLSWTELFIDYAQHQNITRSSVVVPSFLLQQPHIPATVSVNYAWGSALAATGCYNKAYHAFATCKRSEIWQARQHYWQQPSTKNRYALKIPAISNQVEYFMADRLANRVHSNSDTVFAFWSGGNNMIDAYNKLLDGHIIPTLHFLAADPTAVSLKAIAKLLRAIPIKQQPKTVYLFNLMNPGLTPGYYHSKVATLAYILSNIYNAMTRLRVDWFNLTHNHRVTIVPIYQWYQQAHSNSYFRHHLGQACQTKGGDFTQSQHIPNNCEGFMYWNDVHPAVDMQKITAYRFLSLIKQTTASRKVARAATAA